MADLTDVSGPIDAVTTAHPDAFAVRPVPGEPAEAQDHEAGETAEARLVAGITFRELLRRPGGWVATMLTGVLFALLIAALGFSGEKVQDRVEGRQFKIAIGGDLAGAKGVIEAMQSPRLRLEPVADVEDAVTRSQASAGVKFPPDVDGHLARNEVIDFDMYVRASQNNSVEAFNTVAVRLQEVGLQQLASARGHDLETGGIVVELQDLPRDARVNQVQLARQLAPIAALLCIGVVTSVASVFGAARERRSIEPLLVLPLRRSSITLGIAGGAYPLACLQVLAAVVLLVLTAALPSSTNHQEPATLLAMLIAAVFTALVLALVATAMGCIAGSLGTGSDDAVSLGDLVSIVFVAAGVLVFAAPTVGDSVLMDAVPVLGQVLLMRDLVAGDVQPLGIVLSVASAVLTFAWAVRFAGRRLEDEKRLARAIR